MNQWSSVRKGLEEEERRQAQAEQDAFDPKVQERKKKQEIEKWKSEQLRSGLAEENANFQVGICVGCGCGCGMWVWDVGVGGRLCVERGEEAVRGPVFPGALPPPSRFFPHHSTHPSL
jgi:hypothetical protein